MRIALIVAFAFASLTVGISQEPRPRKVSGDAQVKIFKDPYVTVRVVATDEERSDVLLEDVKDSFVTDAIVQVFYYRPSSWGRLLLAKTATCPAGKGIATGCDRFVDLPLKDVEFVRVKLLQEVRTIDAGR